MGLSVAALPSSEPPLCCLKWPLGVRLGDLLVVGCPTGPPQPVLEASPALPTLGSTALNTQVLSCPQAFPWAGSIPGMQLFPPLAPSFASVESLKSRFSYSAPRNPAVISVPFLCPLPQSKLSCLQLGQALLGPGSLQLHSQRHWTQANLSSDPTFMILGKSHHLSELHFSHQ